MTISSKKLAIIVLGLLLPVSALAMPATPHQFYGTVSFDNGSAPNGLLVEAKIDNTVVGSTLTNNGRYGDSVFYIEDPSGNRNGKTIEFYVSGINSGETYIFSNGASTNLNLTVPGIIGTIQEANENSVIENETAVITPSQSTNIKLGANLNINVSSATSTSALVNEVRHLTDTFFTGSHAVIAGNNVLNAFEINITGTGLTIQVTITYNDASIDENTVRPYRFNGTSWVEITPFTIDKSANTITFSVSSAQTPYAVFGSAPTQTSPTESSGGGGGGGGGEITTPVTYKTGDIDKSNKIDIFDFNTLMVNWGNSPSNSAADLDNNGTVDIFDFNLLMVNWG
jgi:hypothetical protein